MHTGPNVDRISVETPPPKNWRPREKLETPPPKKNWRHPPRKLEAPRDQTPPVNRITHACENITLAKTSFRPVKIS